MYRLLCIIMFSWISISFISCNSHSANKRPEENAVPVTTEKVKSEKTSFYNSYPANVVALKEVQLRGQVAGYITGIFFDEGTVVHKGQKLYEIDRRKYESAYEVAKANVKIAQSNLEKVQLDADRYTELSKQDAVAKQLLDHVLADLQTAKQQVSSANAQLISAETDLNYSLITTPFDGTIGISQVKLGSSVTPGQTLLNTISSDDPIGADFEINETELSRFQLLDKTTFSDKDTTFRITLPDNSYYPFSGKISVIDRAVNPQTGTITVRFTFPNKDRILKPGMSCKVLVLNKYAVEQLVVPYKAVLEQMGEYFVYVVNDNKVKQVKITLGPQFGSNVIIKSGLNDGETIVVDGIQKLHDASAIDTSIKKQETRQKQ